MRVSNRWAFVVIAAALVLGVGSYLKQYRVHEEAAAERASLVQSMDADSLNPMHFQSRCGDPDHRVIDRQHLSFFLSYDSGNVTVQYVAKDAKEFATRIWSKVDYWQSKPLRVMTVQQIVERLGCALPQ